jgi:hypothetical protein
MTAHVSARFAAALDALRSGEDEGAGADYRLGVRIAAAFPALSEAGFVCLVVPLREQPDGLGRASAGSRLTPIASMEFAVGGTKWSQPAAVLECTDAALIAAFLVLAGDVAERLYRPGEVPAWREVVRIVDEWQALLGRKKTLSPSAELGLWGEVWVIGRAGAGENILQAWRGPDCDPQDFLLGGLSVEVKVSNVRFHHHFSLTQVERPAGDLDAKVVSMWAAVDPVKGKTLPALVDEVLARASDPALFLRGLALAGYSSVDRDDYKRRFVLLEAPCWFDTDDVPRVRAVDEGVLDVRYEVQLDPDLALTQGAADELWGKIAGTGTGVES